MVFGLYKAKGLGETIWVTGRYIYKIYIVKNSKNRFKAENAKTSYKIIVIKSKIIILCFPQNSI